MNFKHEIHEWGNHKYLRVSKKRFENFVRFFRDKIESDFFMGWVDFYDWSLNPGFDADKATHNELWDNASKCKVARKYVDYGDYEYYIRLDYIEANKYDLDTVVPKPRKKRLTKKEKQFADMLGKAFDNLYRKEVEGEIKNEN